MSGDTGEGGGGHSWSESLNIFRSQGFSSHDMTSGAVIRGACGRCGDTHTVRCECEVHVGCKQQAGVKA